MTIRLIDINVAGRSVKAPSVTIDDTTFVSGTRFPRVARIKDEPFTETAVVVDPERMIRQVVASGLPADVLTFAQKIDEREARHPYYFEWDNVAAASTENFSDWWTGLPQATRKNCRRAERDGIVVRRAVLDQALAEGIKRLYDESPFRQGRRFWHYGKSLEAVHQENSTYRDRSEFLAAHLNDELVGFMKFVYVGHVATIMQILASTAHFAKRPMNALIAKAVEVCSQNGMSYLVYSKFHFGNKIVSPLSEFKSRNGFNCLEFPRYYIPLNVRGRIAINLRLHRGLLGLLPSPMIGAALSLRERINSYSQGAGTAKLDDVRSPK